MKSFLRGNMMEFRDEYNNGIQFSFTEKDSKSTSLSFDVNVRVDEFVGSLKEVWFYFETFNCFKESLIELMKGRGEEIVLCSLSPEELEIKITKAASLRQGYIVTCRIMQVAMGSLHLNRTLEVGIIVDTSCLEKLIQDIKNYSIFISSFNEYIT